MRGIVNRCPLRYTKGMPNQHPKPLVTLKQAAGALSLVVIVSAGAYGFTRLPEPMVRTVLNVFSPLAPQTPPALDAPRISIEETRKLEGALLVDVRGSGPFDKEHIAGAISVPNHEIANQLAKLPKDRTIICYCSCPDDHLSLVAASKLIKQHGYPKAYALAGGLPRWKQLGYPLVTKAQP